jgi:dCMP deaminase
MRLDWDTYFMDMARTVASRASCPRKHVGAVLVLGRTILSTGYNGSLPGQAHCDEVGCMMDGGHCVRSVHAEANAIVQAAKHGVRIDGAAIYTTASPCWSCFKLLATAGVWKVVYGEVYGDVSIEAHAKLCGIELVSLTGGDR